MKAIKIIKYILGFFDIEIVDIEFATGFKNITDAIKYLNGLNAKIEEINNLYYITLA